ncbi:hypothetical protein [Saccharopolyspora dendranthemae]|uniref:hypothetical protein n=1 Tax=Saccharopolyspora dendranthemae TaxID=1181886 RepID=UPI0011A24794|nr:hypothetical protein [Saccharopolyspora dendranthemae]
MDFRKSLTGLLGAFVWIALGCGGIYVFVEAVTGETGVRIPYFLVLAPVAVVVGLVKLVKNLLRSLTMRIDERGILIHHSADRVKVELGWQYVAAVSVTQLPTPKDPRSTADYLVVWTHGGFNPGVPPEWAFQNDGWTGYRLIALGALRESAEQVTQALQHYAAPVLR